MLFESVNHAQPAVDVAQLASDEACSIPAPILLLDGVYRDEMALRLAVGAQVDQLESRLRMVEQPWSNIVPLGGREGVGINIDALEIYTDRVVAYARKVFSSEGAPFKGNLDDYKKGLHRAVQRTYMNNGEYADRAHVLVSIYSPIAAWKEIAKQFDPDAQRKAENIKAARVIRGAFGMLRGDDTQMRVVKGRAEVSIQVWTEEGPKGRRFGYQSSITDVGKSLQQFAADAGLAGARFGTRFAELCQELGYGGGRPIISRERVDLGDGADVVLGYSAFKLYLPLEIAGMINMFLAEYPQPE